MKKDKKHSENVTGWGLEQNQGSALIAAKDDCIAKRTVN